MNGIIIAYALELPWQGNEPLISSIPLPSFDWAFVRHGIGDDRYFLAHFNAAAHAGSPAFREYAASKIPSLREDQAKIMSLSAEFASNRQR